MKVTTEAAFFEEMQGNAVPHLLFLVGGDPFQTPHLQKRALLILEERIGSRPLFFDLKENGSGLLKNELSAPSLFGEAKLYVLKNVEALSVKEEKELVPLMEKSSQTFFCSAAKAKASSVLAKAAKEKGLFLEAKKLTAKEQKTEAERCIAAFFRKCSKSVDPSVVALLSDAYAGDFHGLESELEKLDLYTLGEEKVTKRHLNSLCELDHEESIFAFSDAILGRKKALCFTVAGQLLDQGIYFVTLIRSLRRAFQTDCQIASILKTSPNPEQEVTRLFPYMRGRILSGHISTAKKWGEARLSRAIAFCDEIEFKYKDSGQSEKDLLFELVGKIQMIR